MKKELTIKVRIDSSFDIDVEPNLNDWEDATDCQRKEYVKEKVREFLLEQIDSIVDDLIDDSRIEF